MSIYIEKVRIQNFRSLYDVEVTLSPSTTLLVGANNSGKTSFLRALAIALHSDRRFVSVDDLFIDKEGIPSNEKVIKIDVKIVPLDADRFDDQWLTEFGDNIKQDASGKDFLAFRTLIDLNDHIRSTLPKRFVIHDWESREVREDDEVKANLSTIPFYFIDAQRDLNEDISSRTSHFGRIASRIEYDEEQRKILEKTLVKLNEDAVNQSEILAHLKTSLTELNRTVQTKGKGVEITPFPKKIRDLHKGIKVHFQDGTSDSFSLEYHGMGTRSWASLLAFKANISWDAKEKQEENEAFFPVLALEEPEAHLHPNAQRQVYKQLTEISSGQKIISTHSPYIVGQAKLEEIRHFRKDTDKTEVTRLDIDSFSEEEKRKVRREVINTRGELLFARAVVLFEGETEEQALPIFAEHYWEMDAFEKGICFIGCGGNNYRAFLRLLTDFHVKWFIFSDYDNEIVAKGVKSALKMVGIDEPKSSKNMILLCKSFEAYLISEGYQQELKQAVIEFEEPTYVNEKHREAKQPEIEQKNQEIRDFNDEQLLKELKEYKTKLAPIYSQIIVETEEQTRQIPPKIKKLFQAIDKELTIPLSGEDESDAVPL